MDPTWTTSTVIGLLAGAVAAGGLATWVTALRAKVGQLERRLEAEKAERTAERQQLEHQVARLAEKQGIRMGQLEEWIHRREAAESALAGRAPRRLPPRRPTEPGGLKTVPPVPHHVGPEDSDGED